MNAKTISAIGQQRALALIAKISAIASSSDRADTLFAKAANAIAVNLGCRASITCGTHQYNSEDFAPTTYHSDFASVTQQNQNFTLQLHFPDKKQHDNFTRQRAELSEETFNILLNILISITSKQYLRQLAHDDSERRKELMAMNKSTQIIGQDLTLKETLQKICNNLPQSWQYPDVACARIVCETMEFTTRGFKETQWTIKEPFATIDDKKGYVQICYTLQKPLADIGPFLAQEQQLLANIARIVCGYINTIKGRQAFNNSKRGVIRVHKSEDFRKSLTKDKLPLQLFFNKQVLDKYIYLDMMQYKVKNILFVATLYDAFILQNEDSFFEQSMGEIYQYSLFSLPRITGVRSPQEAMDLLKTSHFDLVVLMVGLDKKLPIDLSIKIKKRHKELPIYLLVNQKADIKHFDQLLPTLPSIDNLFVWNGNSQIFFAIVKSIEDASTVENDTKIGLVRVILLIEDSPQYYSRYLQTLYAIVFEQIQQLIANERNEMNKISKMRSRPKILHARNYEEAMFFYEKYKDFLQCLISDVEFEHNGKLDKEAGIHFIQHVKEQAMAIPTIIQSSEPRNKALADALGVTFLNKDSNTLFADLKKFLVDQLGFGNFVFRDRRGLPLAEAHTLEEFKHIFAIVPDEAIYKQAIENQFSLWFMSRGEIQLAKTINPLNVADFNNMDEYRKAFLDTMNHYENDKKRGKILDFNDVEKADEHNIVSLAKGSHGGKGRGLAFINTLIYNLDFSRYTKEINILTPVTAIIGTDEFDNFMASNNLYEIATDKDISYLELRRCFVEARLSDHICEKLARFIAQVEKPLAVRSSSLSEDSINQPFAGVFDTYVVPNNRNHKCDLDQLTKAIKLVYASIYSEQSKDYFKTIGHKVQEEKMAVVLQELVGSEHEQYYYPHISGTAQSYNYYPIAHMKPEEGFAVAATGLGYYVVGGQKSFRFSPRYPETDIFTTQELLDNTQVSFCALDLDRTNIDYLHEGEDAPLAFLDIDVAEKHGTIKHCASVYNVQNDTIEPGLSCPGPRIINFADILKYDYIPLAQMLSEILEITQDALGSPVEMEWAVDLTPAENDLPSFYLLQIKPMALANQQGNITIPSHLSKRNALLYTENSLGNGIISSIQDVIFALPDCFSKMETMEMATEIDYLNNKMMETKKHYVLIGPGRWGTRDKFLGVPVAWSQISYAKIIVEISLPGFPLDSSLGSHFFHNVTSMGIGYFSVHAESPAELINWDALKKAKIVEKTAHFAHVRFPKPIEIIMDGKQRKAAITLPSSNPKTKQK